MPELPEVETTLQGIKPHIENVIIKNFTARQPKLRWPIPPYMQEKLFNNCIIKLNRRGKYLIMTTNTGSIIMHLGMSGRVKILHEYIKPEKHDHVDIEFDNNIILRYTDPRRFGCILWSESPYSHPLIVNLGIEPFDINFTGDFLHNLAKNRSLPIKSFVMDSKIVVGVGNIYATEVLFKTNIHPSTPAKLIKLEQMHQLVAEIKIILKNAIAEGGTTLKDFLRSDGKPGYFVQQLQMYGRVSKPCFVCKSPIEAIKIGQRTTSYCPTCQIQVG
jgi:formamidopyrimidine-DNA glycosylase